MSLTNLARYCLDASVVLARLFREDYPQLKDFWRSASEGDELIGAQLLRPECMAVIRENVAKGRFLASEGTEMIEELIALPLTIADSVMQFRRANELAMRFSLQKGYDVQYLAVADIERCELVTVDGGMRQRAVELHLPHLFLR